MKNDMMILKLTRRDVCSIMLAIINVKYNLSNELDNEDISEDISEDRKEDLIESITKWETLKNKINEQLKQ